MHIPSARVRSEMNSENASLWFVPANDGAEIAMLVKAPTTSVKALLAGCELELAVGVHGGNLCTGIRIFDIPDAPVFISGVSSHMEEHDALQRALQATSFPIFLFNEMDLCLAWADASLVTEDAEKAQAMLGPAKTWYVGTFGPGQSHSLDCFTVSEDPTLEHPGATKMSTMKLRVLVSPWAATKNFLIGDTAHHAIAIDSQDEGAVLENAVWASLVSVFPNGLCKSPNVTTGDKTRELTDVLAWYEHGAFLIETKDLSILQAGFERAQDRRVASAQKHALKAIGQLVGAAKALARGDQITDAKGRVVSLPKGEAPHCIVLLTELSHTGDWEEVEKKLKEAMIETGAVFNVVDLLEWVTLLKGSAGKAHMLDYNLVGRCKVFAENGSIHIRSR